MVELRPLVRRPDAHVDERVAQVRQRPAAEEAEVEPGCRAEAGGELWYAAAASDPGRRTTLSGPSMTRYGVCVDMVRLLSLEPQTLDAALAAYWAATGGGKVGR